MKKENQRLLIFFPFKRDEVCGTAGCFAKSQKGCKEEQILKRNIEVYQ